MIRGDRLYQYDIQFFGLEDGYMQKLALYFKQRLGTQAKIRLSYHSPDLTKMKNVPDAAQILIGTPEALKEICIPDTENSVLKIGLSLSLVQESKKSAEQIDRIDALQPRTVIYRDFLQILTKHGLDNRKSETEQNWIVVCETGNGSMLLPYAVGLSQHLSEKGDVLFLDFCALDGFHTMFAGHQTADLSDLLMDLRRRLSHPEPVSSYTGMLGSFFYIAPPKNPAVLLEFNAQDMRALGERIREEGQFRYVVAAAFTMLPGWKYLLDSAGRIDCIRNKDVLEEIRYAELKNHIQQCGIALPMLREVLDFKPALYAAGAHLVEEWAHGVGVLKSQTDNLSEAGYEQGDPR